MKKTMRGRRKRGHHGNGKPASSGKGEIASRGDPGTSRNGAQAPSDDAAILGATATTPVKEVARKEQCQAPSTDSKCYTRRRAATLEVAAPSSCPAFSKRQRFKRPMESASCNNIEDATSDTDAEEDAPKPKTIFPFPKKFVEEQKAYFAEVDAFELQEEDTQSCSQC